MSKKLIIVTLVIVLILAIFLKNINWARLERINKVEFSVSIESPEGSDVTLIINAFWVFKNFPSLIVNINKTDEALAVRVKDVLSAVIECEISAYEVEDLKLAQNRVMALTNDLLADRYIKVNYVNIRKE
ncbi:MAG: hypothetical protein KKD05_07135 [Candidatus Omnitrophica bacterium]|nr:hypothetical protein [Candidatus Omnitrophota bacterium]